MLVKECTVNFFNYLNNYLYCFFFIAFTQFNVHALIKSLKTLNNKHICTSKHSTTVDSLIEHHICVNLQGITLYSSTRSHSYDNYEMS